MQYTIYPENERGFADHGWLKAKHSFSFANYYNPQRMNFGALRVLNDDFIAPKMGFGTHPHDNMEIITIVLSGQLQHKDSMGNTGNISAGEIQVMSAGTGIYHSEVNNGTEPLTLFQIWIEPNQVDIEPRYDQKNIDYITKPNDMNTVVGPKNKTNELYINQDAWIKMGYFNSDMLYQLNIEKPTNGVYIMVIEGSVTVESKTLQQRDAIGVWNTDMVMLNTAKDTKLLAIEVPLTG